MLALQVVWDDHVVKALERAYSTSRVTRLVSQYMTKKMTKKCSFQAILVDNNGTLCPLVFFLVFVCLSREIQVGVGNSVFDQTILFFFGSFG